MSLPFTSRLNPLVIAALLWVPSLSGQAAPARNPAADSAQTFYFAYRSAFAKANALEDLKPWMTADGWTETSKVPPVQRPKVFKALFAMSGSIGSIRVIDRVANRDTVVLRLTGVDRRDRARMKGAAIVVREQNSWRLRREEWSSVKP